ncbi:MAG: glycosyltransferase family 4 protein, partial [Halothiobacillaceae bacterium]
IGSLLLSRPDYLFVESTPLFTGLAGFWLSRLKSTRMIFNVSDLWPESAVRLGMLDQGSLAYRVSAWLEAFCYHKAWLVTGQARSILSDITRRFPSCPTFHLSNGVDTRTFGPDKRTEAARTALGSDHQCVALYAGLHGLAQGLDQVLVAARELSKDENLRFVLIGDGPTKKSLVEYAARHNIANVRFVNPRPSSEIPALLAAADIALVTLKTHIPGAVPSKLYEAMASARPIVLVASGEAADIVRDHQAGIVVEPGDIAGLVQAIRTLRNQPDLRQDLGKNGRRAAEQYFDRSKIVSRFIDHLEKNLQK